MAPPRFRFKQAGTKFKIYLPNSRVGLRKPIAAYVDAAPGTIKAGPVDDRVRVVDAKVMVQNALGARRWEYKSPYKNESGHARATPPWLGYRHDPVRPNRSGHFDHKKIRPGSRAFSAAAAFATVRCVLDIWEHALGRPLAWFFRETYPRLEIIPRADSDTGWSGEGFIELGFSNGDTDQGPLAENFDVVAHEAGHLIFKSVVGNPPDDRKTFVYRAHEEAAADLVALVAAMHFDEVVSYALDKTKGRLFRRNVLARIGDSRVPSTTRLLANTLTLDSDEAFAAQAAYDKHTYSLVFSGALYDVLMAIYQDRLRGLGALQKRPSRVTPSFRDRLAEAEAGFPRFTPAVEPLFTEALLQARDYFARLLARTWSITAVNGFSYEQAAANVVAADQALSNGQYGDIIRALFIWRGIDPAG